MNRWRAAFFITVCVCLLAVSLFAQEGTGGITGRVIDSQGAVVANAKVTATNVDTQVQTTASSDSAGVYELLNLIPGRYSVEASAPNFKKILRPNVLVQVEDHIGLDFKLEVGSFNEEVTVTTEAPQLRTEDAQTGEVVTENMIETLPQLNRDPLQLLVLSGNVQGSGDRAGWNLGVGTAGNPSGGFFTGPADTRINGGRAGGVEYLIDGVPATGGFVHNVVNATPTTDDVQEFKVITNGISSEFGRLSGGVVEVSTKSGNNGLHGQLFEYNQNAFLDANTWTDDNICAANPPVGNGPKNAACTKANFRRNRWGFAVGGPVVIPHIYNGKSKTFFFANAEWHHESTSGNAAVGSTISAQERSSLLQSPVPCPDGTAGGCVDLSDIGITGNSTYPHPDMGDPFMPSTPCTNPTTMMADTCLYPAGGDGMHIPINEVNPQIKRVVAAMPLPTPNFAPQFGGTAGNYLFTSPGVLKELTWDLRGDHVINDKQRIFGRFSHNSASNLTAAEYPNFGAPGTEENGSFSASLHYDYTISPTLVLDLNVGGNYTPAAFGTFINGGPVANTADWGFSPQVTGVLGNNLLSFGQIWTEGHDTGAPVLAQGLLGTQFQKIATTNFSYSAALTKIMGRHTLKFGYEGRRYYDNVQNSAGSNGDGNFITPDGDFLHGSDNANGPGWGNTQAYANGLGTFFWGIDTWSQQTAATSRDLASNYYASYLQDDFKVNRKLTLNLGIRWEMQTPVTERNNNISVWDPLAASPFTLPSNYAANWINTLEAAGLTAAQANSVQVPSWVLADAFAPGAQRFVATPEHPSRLATPYQPWNFAPRLGFAYQALHNTVVRGSFGLFYLPIGGNLSDYGDAPGVAYATQWTSTNAHPCNVILGCGLQTITAPYVFPSQEENVFSHNNGRANVQTAAVGNGTGGVLATSHMPHEYDWSLGVQRQLPHDWLVELTYAGNDSNTLFGLQTIPSEFPANLYNGGAAGANALLYGINQNTGNPYFNVASPTVGQIIPGSTSKTGDIQPLGMLEYKYPYFGPVNIENANIGAAHYESGNLRVQKRFSDGLQLLLNYTYSRALDDVGAANLSSQPNQGGPGSNGKAFQSVLPEKSVYGLAAADQTHRLSFFYNYNLPFGRGRHWMNSPQGVPGAILENAVGGWEFSGISIWKSGTPVNIQSQNTQVDQGIDIWSTFASLAPGDTLKDTVTPGFSDPRKALCALPCQSSPPAGHPTALVASAIANNANAQTFTLGNIPPNLGLLLRNPRAFTTDMSVMKSFPIASEGRIYFQLRLEGQNIFNHPTLGNYDTNPQDTTYGMITGVSSTERHVQVSGRLVF
jgi:hypothetical protein